MNRFNNLPLPTFFFSWGLQQSCSRLTQNRNYTACVFAILRFPLGWMQHITASACYVHSFFFSYFSIIWFRLYTSRLNRMTTKRPLAKAIIISAYWSNDSTSDLTRTDSPFNIHLLPAVFHLVAQNHPPSRKGSLEFFERKDSGFVRHLDREFRYPSIY